jgi:hypothetical protein
MPSRPQYKQSWVSICQDRMSKSCMFCKGVTMIVDGRHMLTLTRGIAFTKVITFTCLEFRFMS